MENSDSYTGLFFALNNEFSKMKFSYKYQRNNYKIITTFVKHKGKLNSQLQQWSVPD